MTGIEDQAENDAELLRVAHQRQRRLFLTLCAVHLLVAFALLGFATQAVVDDGAAWWLIPILPLVVLIPMGLLAGLFGLQRRGHRLFPQPIRLHGADRATRRRVYRSVTRGELPADEPDRGLGLEMARATDRARWVRWTNPILVAVFVFNTTTAEHQWAQALWGAGAVLMLGLAIYNWRMYARVHALVEREAG